MEKVNSLKNKCNLIFNYVFFILFCLIALSAAAVIFKNIYVILLTAITGLIILFIGRYVYTYDKIPDDKQINIIFIILFAFMIFLQLIVGYCLISQPMSDLLVVDTISRNYAENGSYTDIYGNLSDFYNHYMARYPNNNGILLLLSFYYRLVYLTLGYIPSYAPIALNTLFISISVLFTFLISKKIFDPTGGGILITLLFCFIFAPYYTYTAYYYTDSLSMPFVSAAVYLLILGAKAENSKLKKRIICLASAGAIIAVGVSIKGSILVILIASIVYIALENMLKQAIIGILCVMFIFSAASIGIKALAESLHFTTEEELYEEQYPLNHWIMMGLQSDGRYNADDSKFTRNSGNYDEKKAAVNEEIKNRLNEMGFLGMAEHIYKKLSYTWGDGTYFISYHLNIYENENRDLKSEYNPLFEYILKSGKHYKVFSTYSNTLHMLMLIFILFSAYYGIRRNKINEITLIKGIVFGAALFFLLWEARSRYIFNFTPLLILIASDGIEKFMRKAPKIFNWHKTNKSK